MESKDELDELNEGCTRSARVNKFLNNIADPDHAEDARAFERSESSLDHALKAIRRVQRKINLEREKHELAQSKIV